METNDLAAVAAIEAVSSPCPWSERLFANCLAAPYFCIVADCNGDICGFGIVSHGAGEGQIVNIAMHPKRRRLGVGRKVLNRMLQYLRQNAVSEVFLEVRESNKPALKLYLRTGFKWIGVRKAYYAAGPVREDAVAMKLDLALTRVDQ